MTLLEKIIYIADYMEPNRDFPGVDRLREAVWRDLDEGVLLGIDMTLEQLAKRASPPAPIPLRPETGSSKPERNPE